MMSWSARRRSSGMQSLLAQNPLLRNYGCVALPISSRNDRPCKQIKKRNMRERLG
jgi:hypothetical protein